MDLYIFGLKTDFDKRNDQCHAHKLQTKFQKEACPFKPLQLTNINFCILPFFIPYRINFLCTSEAFLLYSAMEVISNVLFPDHKIFNLYIFVSRYYDRRDAEDAIDALNGRTFDGRELRITVDLGRPARYLPTWFCFSIYLLGSV